MLRPHNGVDGGVEVCIRHDDCVILAASKACTRLPWALAVRYGVFRTTAEERLKLSGLYARVAGQQAQPPRHATVNNVKHAMRQASLLQKRLRHT